MTVLPWASIRVGMCNRSCCATRCSPHPELVAEHPGESALARAVPPAELGQAGGAVRGSIPGRPDSARHCGAGDSIAVPEIANI